MPPEQPSESRIDGIALSLFSSRITAVCAEMGAILRRTALSPNIRDRLDYSCAVFDAAGQLAAQAAHIPVHLGSMAFAMGELVSAVDWQPGDQLIVNDPYRGGTHLPDVTLVAPCFVDGVLIGFVANRAHHADIGADSPGSMPISKSLHEEGLLISPRLLVRGGQLDSEYFAEIVGSTRSGNGGDFHAQLSANRVGVKRLAALATASGLQGYSASLVALNDYAETLMQSALATIPAGSFKFADVMDDDGLGNTDIPIVASLTAANGEVSVDFAGTAGQVEGNVNCPLAVTAAAVFYAFRCLLPAQTPACAGAMRPLKLKAEAGLLVNARYPAAVAAGNVETSTRIVDVVLGALAQALPDKIPAASQGSMNNLAMGGSVPRTWDYYETIGGGTGGGPEQPGLTAVQSHMTNTLNTPVEVLEMTFPLRVHRYSVRKGSGGAGLQPGGDGLIREFEFLQAARFTLLTERRRSQPWGLKGGNAAQSGSNVLQSNGLKITELPPKYEGAVSAGDRLTISTPGGGGWGSAA